MAVALEMNNKVYPKDVRKFLMGLYATLHLTDNATAKDMEKLVYYAFRNGYLLGVKSEGGDDQKAYDRLPDLGVEEDIGDDLKRQSIKIGNQLVKFFRLWCVNIEAFYIYNKVK